MLSHQRPKLAQERGFLQSVLYLVRFPYIPHFSFFLLFFLAIEFENPSWSKPLFLFLCFFLGDSCYDLVISFFGGNSPATLHRLSVAVGVLRSFLDVARQSPLSELV